MTRRVLCILLPLLLGGLAQAEDLDFVQEVRPVLSDSCYNCHGPDAKARKAKLRLDDRATAMKAGILTDGEMLKRLTSKDPDERMPPPDSKRVLRPKDRAKLVQWLKSGADWPQDDSHWAFVPPTRPALPTVKDEKWSRNEIDRFILAAGSARGRALSVIDLPVARRAKFHPVVGQPVGEMSRNRFNLVWRNIHQKAPITSLLGKFLFEMFFVNVKSPLEHRALGHSTIHDLNQTSFTVTWENPVHGNSL